MSINANEMIRKLQACPPYTEELFPFKTRDLAAPDRSEEIRQYFNHHTDLDLNRIASSGLSTWE